MHHGRRFAPRPINRRGADPLNPAACAQRRAERVGLLLRTDVRRALAEHDGPVLLLEPERVRQSFRRLQAALPSVRMTYPIETLPVPAVLDAITAEGGRLAISSDSGLDVVVRAGLVPSCVVHTHPIKTQAQIRAAFDAGVRVFVIDHVCELVKFDGYGDSVRLLIRVSGHDSGRHQATEGHGVDRAAAAALVAAGLGRGTRIAGFTLGGARGADPAALRSRVAAVLDLIDDLQARLPVRFDLLDLGDCFAVEDSSDGQGDDPLARAEAAADAIAPVLATCAPGVEIMALAGAALLFDALSLVHRTTEPTAGFRVDDAVEPARARQFDVVTIGAMDPNTTASVVSIAPIGAAATAAAPRLQETV